LELQLNNKLSGRFDEVMRAIPELEFFDFSNTDLEGKIPIESMTELRVFTAWNTEKLAGSIPTEIGSWRKLGKTNILNLQSVGSVFLFHASSSCVSLLARHRDVLFGRQSFVGRNHRDRVWSVVKSQDVADQERGSRWTVAHRIGRPI
jgi:hypothetical protein